MSDSTVTRPAGGWRTTTSVILLVLLFFSAAAANFSIWIQTTITRTESFVETFSPLTEDESVAQLLGQKIADAAVDPQQTAANISARLPEELQPLAAPAATAINELAANTATRLIESDAFDAVWERTLRAAHSALIGLLDLRQDIRVLVVDVQEAADNVSQQLETIGITITVPDTPNVTLLSAAGQNSVTLNLLRFIYSSGWVFPALFLVLVAAVVFVGPDRRRAVSLLGLVTATALVFDLVVMRILRAEFGEQANSGLAVNAVHSAWDTVTTRLRWQTWLALLVALLVWALARYVGNDIRTAGAFPGPRTVAFLDRWGTGVEIVAIVFGLLLMLFVPSMTLGLALLIAVIVAGIVIFVSWVQRQPADSPPIAVDVDD
ncbi:MAG: hypothetical protein WAL25_10305 [Acidimicrobiia bacterium]